MADSIDARPGIYRKEWMEYRRLVRHSLGMALGWLPFGAAAMAVAVLVGYDPVFFVLTGAYMVRLLVVSVYFSNWACPRCKKPFVRTWWYNAGFLANACVHCGLRKYEFENADEAVPGIHLP